MGAKQDRQKRVLDAAMSVVGSAGEVAWLRAVSFEEIEIATGIDRRQVVRDFGSKDKLMEALIQHWHINEVEKYGLKVTAPILDSREEPADLYSRLSQIAALSNSFNRDSKSFVVQMAIWSLQTNEPAARKALREMYQDVDVGVNAVTEEFLNQLSAQGMPLVDGISIEELSVLLTAIVEGLAIRHAVDPDAVPDDLTARAWVALVEGIVQSVDEEPRVLGDIAKDVEF